MSNPINPTSTPVINPTFSPVINITSPIAFDCWNGNTSFSSFCSSVSAYFQQCHNNEHQQLLAFIGGKVVKDGPWKLVQRLEDEAREKRESDGKDVSYNTIATTLKDVWKELTLAFDNQKLRDARVHQAYMQLKAVRIRRQSMSQLWSLVSE
jgi:hypothetical protein